MRKLSKAQERLYEQLKRDGLAERPYGTPEAGRAASAFVRTGHVLVERGLARWTYWGHIELVETK